MIEQIEKERIHLFTEKTQSTDSVIPIRWCVSKNLLEKLKEKEVREPHLLLVVVKWGKDRWVRREVIRKLVPLSQMMEYIQFQGSGIHRILATIVWDYEQNVERLRRFLLEKVSHSSYENEVLDYDQEKTRGDYGPIRSAGKGSIDIEVAKEFFAKEPPEWLKWWVNLAPWYETKPVDQCHFRRRCIFAFSIQPFAALIWMIGKIVSTALLGIFFMLCGIRGVNFRPALRPFSYGMNTLWSDIKGSIFVDRQYPFVFPFMPIIVLAGAGLMFLLNPYFQLSIWKMIASLFGALFCFSLLIALFVALIAFFVALFNRAVLISEKLERGEEEREKAQQKRKQEERLIRLQKMYDEKLQPLMCTGEALKASLDALPEKKRTLHLRFLSLKAKVCKPFARY